MKGLLLNDLYNIGHNMKSMLFILVVFVFILVPRGDSVEGVISYIIMCSVLCSTIVITVFSFDHTSGWTPFAITAPLTKREFVAGKYIVMFLFNLSGILGAFFFGTAAAFAFQKISFSGETFLIILSACAAGLLFSTCVGSIVIALLFRFDVEKARFLTFASILVPVGITYGCYRIYLFLNLHIYLPVLAGGIALLLILCCCVMYFLSCRIFYKKEL